MNVAATRGRDRRTLKANDLDWQAEALRLKATISDTRRAAGADGMSFRKAVASLFGEYLGMRRDEARARLDSGGRGADCATFLSRVEDLLEKIDAQRTLKN